MSDPNESAHRHHHRAAGDEVTVREGDEVDGDDGVFEIRMPIASTGAVRNEGDDPLTRDELEGFARQISERSIGVFPSHGADDMIAAGHYSPFERLGNWERGEFETRSEDGEDGVLMATARMPDPEELPAATNEYRQALAILKEQAKRGIDQDASIGWREDDTFPGGNDLMEASMVGIGADWRTNTTDDAAEVVARAATEAGADADELVAAVKRAVGDDDWSGEMRIFRVVAPEDSEEEFDDSVLGVGASFPESGVYVDWHTSAFPDELENPHVSEYGSLGDLRKATGNDVVDLTRPPGSRSDTPDDARPFGPPGGDADEWEDFDACVADVEDWDNIDDPEAFCAWAQDKAEGQSAEADDEQELESDMPDDDTPDGDGGTTDDEQAAGDDAGEQTDRAPDDVSENELLTFVAMHYDGADESDLADAVDAADGEYVGAADVEALADLVSTVTGAEYEQVTDAMSDLMESEQESDEDKDGEDMDDEDDEEEQSANTDDASDADGDDGRDLAERVDELADELQAVKSGEVEVTTPQQEQAAETDDGDDTDTDSDESAERDADAEPDADPTDGLGTYR